MLRAYNRAMGTSYAVTRWPDAENRESKDIDAYAEGQGSLPLAIEHTRVQTLRDQVRDREWFSTAFGHLECELNGKSPFTYRLVFPHSGLTPGQDWKTIADSVKEWFLVRAADLPEGRTQAEIAGVPFPITVFKRKSPRPRVVLSRFPPDREVADALLAEVKESLGHKYARLSEYRQGGAVTLLLLESDDIALVHETDIYRAVLMSMRDAPRPELDQVWLASTHRDDCSVCCLVGPQELTERVNPPNFQFGARFEAEWLRD